MNKHDQLCYVHVVRVADYAEHWAEIAEQCDAILCGYAESPKII
jgi:hypothetical protein